MAKAKAGLHKRNAHSSGYDFAALTKHWSDLEKYVITGKYGKPTINFHDPAAVKCLNQALLIHHYDLKHWDIPDTFLCPAVPGRADYIHYLADLLAEAKGGKIPRGKKIRCLDVGTGANLVYPIVGSHAYGWSFVGTDVNDEALRSAQQILDQNPNLKSKVSLQKQTNRTSILRGIMQSGEYFDLMLCNPPFYSSAEEAQVENQRKRKNLRGRASSTRNFGGQANELWYPGGEKAFIQQLIEESTEAPTQCYWYTSLVAKEQHLKVLLQVLKKVKCTESKVIPMAQGNKNSRILAWTFLNNKQRNAWEGARW